VLTAILEFQLEQSTERMNSWLRRFLAEEHQLEGRSTKIGVQIIEKYHVVGFDIADGLLYEVAFLMVDMIISCSLEGGVR